MGDMSRYIAAKANFEALQGELRWSRSMFGYKLSPSQRAIVDEAIRQGDEIRAFAATFGLP